MGLNAAWPRGICRLELTHTGPAVCRMNNSWFEPNYIGSSYDYRALQTLNPSERKHIALGDVGAGRRRGRHALARPHNSLEIVAVVMYYIFNNSSARNGGIHCESSRLAQSEMPKGRVHLVGWPWRFALAVRA